MLEPAAVTGNADKATATVQHTLISSLLYALQGSLGESQQFSSSRGRKAQEFLKPSGTKNHLGMRRVGNASPVPGSEESALDECLAWLCRAGVAHLVDAGRQENSQLPIAGMGRFSSGEGTSGELS